MQIHHDMHYCRYCRHTNCSPNPVAKHKYFGRCWSDITNLKERRVLIDGRGAENIVAIGRDGDRRQYIVMSGAVCGAIGGFLSVWLWVRSWNQKSLSSAHTQGVNKCADEGVCTKWCTEDGGTEITLCICVHHFGVIEEDGIEKNYLLWNNVDSRIHLFCVYLIVLLCQHVLPLDDDDSAKVRWQSERQ